MSWSLSEFLNLFEFRSQSWCFIDMGAGNGLRAPHVEAAFFYAVLSGEIRLVGIGGTSRRLVAGDIAITLSGEAHVLRQGSHDTINAVALLENGEYVDSPPTFLLGGRPTTAQLLCGRLKMRWPSGSAPRRLPPLLHLAAGSGPVNFDRLVTASAGPGGTSLLTRTATMLFVLALREDPLCQDLFREAASDDPIARAQSLIKMHPFQKWSVEALAHRVGMGRSNFATRFVEQTGMTPMEALNVQRMQHAADLLENTELKVAEISERVGYRSGAAFHQRIVRHFGLPPGGLRRRRREIKPLESLRRDLGDGREADV